MPDSAGQKAIDLLKKASTPGGFVAAVKEEDNYRRVWTRDSALCGLAALHTGDAALVDTFRLSVETVFAQQHKDGFIPSNVSPVTGKASYGQVVGRVDNHAWIIISACHVASYVQDKKWLEPFLPAIDRCFALMRAWEFNGRGLMYVPQSADWADEYVHHGYILYNQLLRLWALRCANALLGDKYGDEALRVQQSIEDYFSGEQFYAPQLERMWQGRSFPYWIMGFNPGQLYTQFDLQANALALLLDIGSEKRREDLVRYLRTQIKPGIMLPSFAPVIDKGDDGYSSLENNYAYRFRNGAHEFHNGGLWPVWNGLMAIALEPYDAPLARLLYEAITAACSTNDWEFNECYHGLDGRAIGVPHCAWSAAGLILAGADGPRNLVL